MSVRNTMVKKKTYERRTSCEINRDTVKLILSPSLLNLLRLQSRDQEETEKPLPLCARGKIGV